MQMVKNILAVVLGLVIGGAINMAIVTLGSQVVPPPAGVDVSDPESIAAAMHLYTPLHFSVPFLAHAVGTFAGALVAYLVAASHQSKIAYGVGAAFLAGGITASFMIPAPAWFIALDLIVAYIPMAWLAISLGRRIKG